MAKMYTHKEVMEKIRLKKSREMVGYGLTYGQVEVIKMQVLRFNATPKQLAKHYKVPTYNIKQVLYSKQFDDIKPVGGCGV